MTISHPIIDLPTDEAVIFAQLGDVSCSVCAPLWMTQEAVEVFATQKLGRPIGGWECVDKSEIGWGSATPNRCNMARGRQYWFLLAALQAAALGFKTKQ